MLLFLESTTTDIVLSGKKSFARKTPLIFDYEESDEVPIVTRTPGVPHAVEAKGIYETKSGIVMVRGL